MNENNYGTREACQRLVDAGIILKTENVWFYGTDEQWHLAERWLVGMTVEQYPAPSMAEVWRELPSNTTLRRAAQTWAWISGKEGTTHHNTNPTDALIDLLIWVKKEAKP